MGFVASKPGFWSVGESRARGLGGAGVNGDLGAVPRTQSALHKQEPWLVETQVLAYLTVSML